MTLQDLFADETRWAQHVYARTKEGRAVSWNDKTATCWCLSGATLFIYGYVKRMGINNVLVQKINELFPDRIKEGLVAVFNDHPDTTIEDIQLVVKEADV